MDGTDDDNPTVANNSSSSNNGSNADGAGLPFTFNGLWAVAAGLRTRAASWMKRRVFVGSSTESVGGGGEGSAEGGPNRAHGEDMTMLALAGGGWDFAF